jgi:hypothetical protein
MLSYGCIIPEWGKKVKQPNKAPESFFLFFLSFLYLKVDL